MVLIVKSLSKFEKPEVLTSVSSVNFVSEDGSDFFNISFFDSSSIMLDRDSYNFEVY